ncbi:ArsR/SmtB family transcription factor [Amycolatopsis jejuensis]|uniref:ArsR/SmtB family transcription factor n=1 Tax=Amycolatopsis jejuensis TaxID=330084 RepID=UPI00068A795E|nr:winged helix-turn-helix domain-containing protein [Amycolatopsis jejuensis]
MNDRKRADLQSTRRVLADPLRIRLLEALATEPQSVKELAEWVGMAADRLYYHLRQLERAGLVEVCEYRRIDGGKVERVYAPVAAEPPAEGSSPAEIAEFLGQMLQVTRVDVSDAFAARERGARREARLFRTTARLSLKQVGELYDHVEKLVMRMRDEPAEDGVRASIVFALTDVQDRPESRG